MLLGANVLLCALTLCEALSCFFFLPSHRHTTTRSLPFFCRILVHERTRISGGKWIKAASESLSKAGDALQDFRLQHMKVWFDLARPDLQPITVPNSFIFFSSRVRVFLILNPFLCDFRSTCLRQNGRDAGNQHGERKHSSAPNHMTQREETSLWTYGTNRITCLICYARCATTNTLTLSVSVRQPGFQLNAKQIYWKFTKKKRKNKRCVSRVRSG